ncbi:glycosyltransferase family 4 protein [Cupriavidus basilensis]|uniref:glycosyltransferase family 4 protein n=1 Tax=Cupriavidus basilensis TaxID=68895 RepID=UPI0009D939DC|nr:glycosyltransferase family 4 protein [Cupriavidus basilensis]
MDYFPNDQAASYFLSEIFPNLKVSNRSWKMYVVGRSPSQALLNCASNDIVITGTVPSIEKYLNEADIVVAPLLSGAGLKNKVLEGMASGKAVIGSSIAFEGIDGEEGVHFLCANSKSEWIESINNLANDDDLREAVGRKGREFVRNQFYWSKIIEEFRAVVLD